MEKKTIEIREHKIVYKDFLTKRDRLAIQDATSGRLAAQSGSQEGQMILSYTEGEKATIKAVLISVDDREGNAMANYLLDLPEEDSDEIFAFINKITQKKVTEAKKK